MIFVFLFDLLYSRYVTYTRWTIETWMDLETVIKNFFCILFQNVRSNFFNKK